MCIRDRHWHFDARFLMQVEGSDDFVVSPESLDLAWVPIAELKNYTTEPTILRMGQKWLRRTANNG